MHEVPLRRTNGGYPSSADGHLFYIASLIEAIPDSSRGVFAEINFAASNPVIRSESTVFCTYVFALESNYRPQDGIKGSLDFPIAMYAFLPTDHPIGHEIEQCRQSKEDSPSLTKFVESLLEDAFAVACRFINILRHSFDQYWLKLPSDLLSWSAVRYCARSEGKEFAILVSDTFTSELLNLKWNSETSNTYQPKIVFTVIDEQSLDKLQSATENVQQTFADEMISVALVEIRRNRVRSAILHAMIAIESATKRALTELLDKRVKGLPTAKVLEAVSREVSTITLAKVVMSHMYCGGEPRTIDWPKLEELHRLRNCLVHVGQRKFPEFKVLRAQLVEARWFVKQIDDAIRN